MNEDEIVAILDDYVKKYTVKERSEVEQEGIQLSKDYANFLESLSIPREDKVKLYRMYIDAVIIASTITEKMYQEKITSIQEIIEKPFKPCQRGEE